MKALMWRPKSKSTNHPLPVDVQIQLSVGAFISMASLANREVSRRMAGMKATTKWDFTVTTRGLALAVLETLL